MITLALLIFVSYTLIAINTVAIAKANYQATFISSTVWMMVNFFLIRFVAEATTWREFIGYLIGGVSGDMLGIYICKRLKLDEEKKS